MKRTAMAMAGLATVAVLGSGCATPMAPSHPAATSQAIMGAALGGLAGGVIGNNSHGAFGNGEGAVAGAALGALLGGLMGHQQDQFNAQLSAVNEMATTTIVNVRNSNGSYTPVTLRRVGSQYVGPRGEYYGALPDEAQLKAPYGF